MGTYCFYRGNAIIKPELIQTLKDRFTHKDKTGKDREPLIDWKDVKLPKNIMVSEAFRELAREDAWTVPGVCNSGSWGFEHNRQPFDLDEDDDDNGPQAILNFNDVTGELEFYGSVRQTYQKEVMAFFILLMDIASSCKVEYDHENWHYREKNWRTFTSDDHGANLILSFSWWSGFFI